MTEEAMENIMPNRKMERNAAADALFSGSLSPLRREENVQSRYLKPSMASCHDYCKYGKKLNYEGANLDLRTFLKKKRREQNQAATPNGEEWRSITIIKPKIEAEPNKKSIYPGAKTLLKSRESNRNEVKSPTLHDKKRRKVIKRRTWMRPQSSQGLNIISLTNLSPDDEADASMEEITKSTVKEPISPVADVSGDTIESTVSEHIPPVEADTSGDPESALSTPILPVAPAKTKQKAPSVRKAQTTNQKALLPPKRSDVAVRSAIILKTRTPLLRSISHLKSSRSLITRRNQEKLKFGAIASKPVKTLKTTKAPLSKVGEGAARPTNTPQAKTLEPLRSIIAERKVLQPPPASVSSSSPGNPRNMKRTTSVKKSGDTNTNLGSDHKTDDPKSAIDEGISKGASERTLRPQDSFPAPYKLKFRKGKVLDLRCDSIGARRLWFRIGKMSGENQNGDGLARKRSFRKKDTDGASDSKLTDAEPQAVVLKHQDTEKKEGGRALFNRVIEETASKLVEARKSKVKALVGAFETVISLQESKPVSI